MTKITHFESNWTNISFDTFKIINFWPCMASSDMLDIYLKVIFFILPKSNLFLKSGINFAVKLFTNKKMILQRNWRQNVITINEFNAKVKEFRSCLFPSKIRPFSINYIIQRVRDVYIIKKDNWYPIYKNRILTTWVILIILM